MYLHGGIQSMEYEPYHIQDSQFKYCIRPNKRPGRLYKFVLYHYCQKIMGDNKWK